MKFIFFICTAFNAVMAQSPTVEPDRQQWFADREYDSRSLARHGWVVLDTSLNHWLGSHEYGKSAQAFGRQLASREGQRFITNLSELTLGSALHEDPRYRPLLKGSFTHRALYAAGHAFLCRTDDGRSRPAYSRFLAVGIGVAAQNYWRPYTQAPGSLSGEIGFAITSKVFDNLWDEFAARKFKEFRRRAKEKFLKKHAFLLTVPFSP